MSALGVLAQGEMEGKLMLEFLRDGLPVWKEIATLIAPLLLIVFGTVGWRHINESKKNLEERYKAELARRDVQIESLKSEVEELKRNSVPEIMVLVNSHKEATQEALDKLKQVDLKRDEKDRIIQELEKKLELESRKVPRALADRLNQLAGGEQSGQKYRELPTKLVSKNYPKTTT